MSALRTLWRRLVDYLAWSVPGDVEDGYPTTLDAFRARREAQAAEDRRLIQHWNEIEQQRQRGRSA